MLHDLRESLGLPGLRDVRVLQRYDLMGLTESEFQDAATHVLSEPQVDELSTTVILG
ncbi:MAG: hypothetical protein RLZZ282_1228, partial [Verrucomicrobiota bacterium]